MTSPNLNLQLAVLVREGYLDRPLGELHTALEQLASGEAFEVAIIPNDEMIPYPRMSIDFIADHGYVVMCLEDDKSIGHYPVTAASLSKPEVEIQLGGQALEKWPAELFVPEGIATRAVRTFVSTGRRDATLSWVANNAFPREIIWQTRAQRLAWEATKKSQ